VGPELLESLPFQVDTKYLIEINICCSQFSNESIATTHVQVSSDPRLDLNRTEVSIGKACQFVGGPKGVPGCGPAENWFGINLHGHALLCPFIPQNAAVQRLKATK
jgi:hypothetical protein